MATQGKRKTAGAKAEVDDARPRQPAWRQAPAKPRKRAKTRAFAAQRSTPPTSIKTTATPRAFARPSREVIFGWFRIGALVMAVFGVAAGLVYLLHWPLLTVDHTSTFIGGAQRITPAELYQKSEVAGRSILVLRADQIQARLRQVPGVATADVHLRLPNEVIIDVIEHAPLVAWQAMTETVWLSADGSVVPQAGAAPPLTLVDQSEGRLAKTPALQTLILKNLAQLQQAAPEIREVYYAPSQGLYYRTAQGWDVWLGESGGMKEKLALASVAETEIARKGAKPKFIDVRLSDRKAWWQ